MGFDIARLQRQLLAATSAAPVSAGASGGVSASSGGAGAVGSAANAAQLQKARDAALQERREAEAQRDDAVTERDTLRQNLARVESERCVTAAAVGVGDVPPWYRRRDWVPRPCRAGVAIRGQLACLAFWSVSPSGGHVFWVCVMEPAWSATVCERRCPG